MAKGWANGINKRTGEKMRTKSPTTINEVTGALRRNRGRINSTAWELGITEHALRTRINKNPKLKELLDEIRESRLDIAEKRLEELIESRDPKVALSATQYFLDRQGKERGYAPTQKMEGKVEVPVTVEIRRFSDAPIAVEGGKEALTAGQDGGFVDVEATDLIEVPEGSLRN